MYNSSIVIAAAVLQTNILLPLRQVKTMQYSVIIFDTAPTGHTLRFLSFPTVLEKALAKVSTLSGRFGPMFQQVSCHRQCVM
jgi:anion-transporting  ArsA/GET3 family ATPase